MLFRNVFSFALLGLAVAHSSPPVSSTAIAVITPIDNPLTSSCTNGKYFNGVCDCPCGAACSCPAPTSTTAKPVTTITTSSIGVITPIDNPLTSSCTNGKYFNGVCDCPCGAACSCPAPTPSGTKQVTSITPKPVTPITTSTFSFDNPFTHDCTNGKYFNGVCDCPCGAACSCPAPTSTSTKPVTPVQPITTITPKPVTPITTTSGGNPFTVSCTNGKYFNGACDCPCGAVCSCPAPSPITTLITTQQGGDSCPAPKTVVVTVTTTIVTGGGEQPKPKPITTVTPKPVTPITTTSGGNPFTVSCTNGKYFNGACECPCGAVCSCPAPTPISTKPATTVKPITSITPKPVTPITTSTFSFDNPFTHDCTNGKYFNGACDCPCGAACSCPAPTSTSSKSLITKTVTDFFPITTTSGGNSFTASCTNGKYFNGACDCPCGAVCSCPAPTPTTFHYKVREE